MNSQIAFLRESLVGMGDVQLAKIQEELETIKHYIGYAGEHLVVSELLLLEVNAVRTGVDEGWDVLAMNQAGKTFLVQVKTAHEKEADRFAFYLSENLLEEMSEKRKKNMVFVFVLLQEKTRNFVVMSAEDVEQELKKENIWKVKTTKRLRFRFYLREGKLYLGNLENKTNQFLNNWKIFEAEKEKSETKQIVC